MDKIQLLDTDLLKKEELFKEITYWKDLLGIKIGWSYMLDFIWQLDRFNSLNLPKGSLILDAGAGNGLLQYILSARGYNVISVDFRPRKLPIPMRWIFPMTKINNADFQDGYIDFMKKNGKPWWIRIPFEIKKILFNYRLRIIPHFFKHYGSIKFIEANYARMPVQGASVDCVVSTSSIEHNFYLADVKLALREFERVLKPGGTMLITAQAAKFNSFFLKNVYAWCFSKETLEFLFNMIVENNYKEYDKIKEGMLTDPFMSRIVRKRFKGRPVQYLPVGIEKWKQ